MIIRATIAALLLAGVALAQTAGDKKLEGRVLSPSGNPVPRATVLADTMDVRFATETDENGRFSFRGLRPGTVLLQARRNNYLEPDAVDAVILTQGEPPPVTITMTRASVIRGRVMDEYGDPVPNAPINIYVRAYANGKWQMELAPTSLVRLGVVTGPDGTFAAGGLAAGRYYVSAGLPIMSPPVAIWEGTATYEGRRRTYLPTFYPSAAVPSGAAPIAVAAESESLGINIRMQRLPAFRVRGKVEVPAGEAPPVLRMTPLEEADAASNTQSQAIQTRPNASDGVFEFQNVPQGSYVLMTHNALLTVRQIVTVNDHDIEDLRVQLKRGAKITGKMRFDSPPAAQLALPELMFQSPDPNVIAQFAAALPDGTFEIHNLNTGPYRVRGSKLGVGHYVKSIFFNRREVLQGSIAVQPEEESTMDVVIGIDGAQVSVVVRNDRGEPMPRVRVRIWKPGGILAVVTNTNIDARSRADGSVSFGGLPPGTYRIAGWESVESGLLDAPEFLRQFDSQATSVTLGPNANEKTDIKLIRKAAIEAATAKLP